ncbi:unnamed protein product, partial [Nesidiocoris tenuis]
MRKRRRKRMKRRRKRRRIMRMRRRRRSRMRRRRRKRIMRKRKRRRRSRKRRRRRMMSRMRRRMKRRMRKRRRNWRKSCEIDPSTHEGEKAATNPRQTFFFADETRLNEAWEAPKAAGRRKRRMRAPARPRKLKRFYFAKSLRKLGRPTGNIVKNNIYECQLKPLTMDTEEYHNNMPSSWTIMLQNLALLPTANGEVCVLHRRPEYKPSPSKFLNMETDQLRTLIYLLLFERHRNRNYLHWLTALSKFIVRLGFGFIVRLTSSLIMSSTFITELEGGVAVNEILANNTYSPTSYFHRIGACFLHTGTIFTLYWESFTKNIYPKFLPLIVG